MNSLGLPNVIFVNDDEKHKTINALDALQNLLYLIRLDVSHPELVMTYVDQSDALLLNMQRQMLPENCLS